MTDNEKLKSPYLLKHIIEEVKKSGIVGNQHGIISISVVSALRLCRNARATSSNLLISASTGAGKDELIKATLDILATRETGYIHRTGLSDKVFRYWEYPSEDIKTWDGVILYLEDPDEDLINGQVFRTVASGTSKASVVGKELSVIHTKLIGKPVLIVTSFHTTIASEGERRWSTFPTDSNRILNDEVKRRKAEIHLEGIQHDMKFVTALRNDLESHRVKIPKVMNLLNFLNSDTVNNTLFDTLCDYVKGSAILHQYSREIDKEGYLIANDDDMIIGLFVFKVLHQGAGSYIENNLISILTCKEESLFRYEIIERYNEAFLGAGITEHIVKKTLAKLTEKKRISMTSKRDERANRAIPAYFLRHSVPKNEKALLTDLSTEYKSGPKSDKKPLSTEYKGSTKIFDIFLEIEKNRAKMYLSNNIFLILGNDLIIKGPSFVSVQNWVKNHKKHLGTEKKLHDVDKNW